MMLIRGIIESVKMDYILTNADYIKAEGERDSTKTPPGQREKEV